MSGLFDRDKALKQRLSHARAKRFGLLPEDREVFLSQMAACAEELRIENPYPKPSKPVDPEEGQQP